MAHTGEVPGPDRRTVLKAGGLVALSPVVAALLGRGTAAAGAPGAVGSAGAVAGAPRAWPTLSPSSLWYDSPATSWENEALPLGNGRLGAMMFGGPDTERIHLNEQSLWGGVNNYDNALAGVPEGTFDTGMLGFGSFRNFGNLTLTFGAGAPELSAPGGPYDTSSNETVRASTDGRTGTKWCVIDPPAQVLWQVGLPTPVAVPGFSLTSANDVPDRDPQQWVLAGSTDGQTWTTLDERTLTAPFETRGQTKHFALDNTVAYRWYRFTFTPKAGVSHFQVAEIALDGVDFAGAPTMYVSSPSGQGDGRSAATDLSRSVDGFAGTAWSARVQDGAPVLWQARLSKAVALSALRLTNSTGKPRVDPAGWTLAGSTDGSTWVTLSERAAGKQFAGPGQTITVSVTDRTAFSHYRLSLLAPRGASQVDVSEVALVGPGLDGGAANVVVDYRRGLDLTTGVHVTRFSSGRRRFVREAFASRAADVMVFRYTADAGKSLSGSISLASGQGAPTTVGADGRSIEFSGQMANGLKHACVVRVSAGGGTLAANGTRVDFQQCTSLVLVVDARTNYAMDAAAGWRGADPAPVAAASTAAAARRTFDALQREHTRAFSALMQRVSVDWGRTSPAVQEMSTVDRLARYAGGEADPTLEQSLFGYSRYLLASSSRPDGLPANLQGLWNEQDQPAWGSDYHTNINVQMNYWGAETTDLPESHEALANFVEQVAIPSRVATRNAFGADTRGWTARTSQSIFGGNGWEWNTVSSAWYAQHLWEHYAFTQDVDYLRTQAYPLIKEICEFWEDRLIENADGQLVAPDGWSPEHGPREDGVMYDQQIIWDLFQNYLDAATALKADKQYRTVIASMQNRLAPNKIGSWGQLQEWQTDRDDPADIHRHTSHLFAVYPGRQITPGKDPELAAAALVSLKARCGEKEGEEFTAGTVSGDSRRSWTWPWRCALFARLGDAERAAIMIRGLLTYNTLHNLFANHPPFQLDGNFGISGAITEMLLQSHADEISLLPAVPEAWQQTGSFSGLRARGGYRVSCRWRNGRVTEYAIVADRARNRDAVKVRVNGKVVSVKPQRG